jgi:response regulator RpfG family c-di-GMP phosphodiesterase
MPIPRYIILFYDHSTKVLSMQQLLNQMPDPVELVSVEHFQHVLKLVDQRVPDAIIVYVNNPVNGYIDCLKDLRINNGNDEIPVYVFTDLPERETLFGLLTRRVE